MNKLLLKGAEVVSADGRVEKADIAIQGSNIIGVGNFASWAADRTIDCSNKLAVPGFVNTHTHAAMSLFRSYADDMLLMDWLQQKIWPAEANLTNEDVYWGTIAAIAEMIKTGTTTFADMYFFMDDVAKAVAETGMRAVLARGMAGIAPTGGQALIESEKLFNDWHQAADERITIMLGPHAPYTCPPDYLRKVVDLSHKLGADIHIHLSETAGEVETCRSKYGKSPIELMDEIGVLDCGVLAAHCVHLSQQDIELMARKNTRVAHNPGSNMKLASGIAPVRELIAAGVCVGLGTDGAASNNNLDLLEEMRLAALLHKVSTGDPTVIPAGSAVDMATKNGAAAVGLGEDIGKIETGYKADVVLYDMNQLQWYPRHDRLSLLTYAANSTDAETVIINGKVVMEQRRLTTIDEERVKWEMQQRGMRLVGQP